MVAITHETNICSQSAHPQKSGTLTLRNGKEMRAKHHPELDSTQWATAIFCSNQLVKAAPTPLQKRDTQKLSNVEAQFVQFSAQESILSQLFERRISHFDVLTLCIEIMKITLKNRESEVISRREERLLQLEQMEEVVKNFKNQSKLLLGTSLGTGILSIFSGFTPILGHMKGDFIQDKLSMLVSSFKDMEKQKFFKALGKMTQSMAQMSNSTGDINIKFSEGDRTRAEQMTRIHNENREDLTRKLEDTKDMWKNFENFLLQILQTDHEVARQLYNR